MRLKKIKLNGFKSFAEPIDIAFRNGMIGVVGPNGCGKSNIVDALRWVMGEKARQIRATTLEDVIFSGTNTRKPVGQAVVELTFDNTDAGTTTKFSQYAELSLRRTVARDQESKYYINSTRCRRRDIADLFFGTGLSGNSYAVMEQGMVTRIVEAKPEEMRTYIEEAAGVSKYKARRRDTENRIRRTRNNLDRLMDIKDEVTKQLSKLKKQVKNAEKFKQLRKDKERFESELLFLKYSRLENDRSACEKQVADYRLDLEKIQAVLREVETNAEKKRIMSEECNDEINRMKEEHYRLSATISSEEKDIEDRKKSIDRLSQERKEVEVMVERNQQEIEKQQQSLMEQGKHCEELNTKVEYFSGEVKRLREESTVAKQMIHEAARKHQGDIDIVGKEISTLRDTVHSLTEALNAEQVKSSDIQSRLASFEALQEAELRNDEGAFTQWIDTVGLKRKDRLVEHIRVADGWERAAETVLGVFIAGVEVSAIEDYADRIEEFNKGVLVLFEGDTCDVAESGTLADKVSGSKGISSFLSRVRLSDSLSDALQRRSSLKPYESLITKDGIWIGPNWMQLCVTDKDGDGVLVRERRMEELREQLKKSNNTTTELRKDLVSARVSLSKKETQRDQLQSKMSTILKKAAALESGVEKGSISVLEDVRNQLHNAQEVLHRFEVDRKAATVNYSAMKEQAERLQLLKEEFRQRLQSLDETLSDLQQPVEESCQRLDDFLKQHAEGQHSLDIQSQKLSELQSEVKTLEQRRSDLNKEVETRRDAYEQARAELQVITARCKDALATFNNLNVLPANVEASMEPDANIESQEERLARVQASIDRLGAINLVALEEFDELSERKEYLDSQHDDLMRALKMLEDAISKIDKETRELFKKTFDQINANLQDIFPRLFGNGEAYLELTENDLLTTGVSIMVRPAGKRRVSINLLSGGEKALAAVAVVFSIFELSPAPFCLLDEVDAPLDDRNVERFCDLLKYMSERVQFIMITHNKVSMEYMDNLIGVTMQEPGVSRLVAVDVEEAAKMATA